jgi:hypothetical protein
VRKGVHPALAIVVALALGSTLFAVEPDGRVVIRYAWPDRTENDAEAPRLRLSMTAVTELSSVRLVARIPSGVGLTVRGGAGSGLWPADGLSIGSLAAGQTVVMEFDVAKPPRGGGILGFVVEAAAKGRAFSEGVGVPVGVPGTAPTLRNGAVEFPASRPDPAP